MKYTLIRISTHIKVHDGNQFKSCTVQQILAYLCFCASDIPAILNENILNDNNQGSKRYCIKLCHWVCSIPSLDLQYSFVLMM